MCFFNTNNPFFLSRETLLRNLKGKNFVASVTFLQQIHMALSCLWETTKKKGKAQTRFWFSDENKSFISPIFLVSKSVRSHHQWKQHTLPFPSHSGQYILVFHYQQWHCADVKLYPGGFLECNRNTGRIIAWENLIKISTIKGYGIKTMSFPEFMARSRCVQHFMQISCNLLYDLFLQ